MDGAVRLRRPAGRRPGVSVGAGGPTAAGASGAPVTVHILVNDPFSKPAISKHLKVLEQTGVVTRVVEGRTHRLSLAPDVLSEAADWMDRQRAVWGRLFDVVDDYLKESR
jgi:DNA-binding transcriptional ArsR family regulator